MSDEEMEEFEFNEEDLQRAYNPSYKRHKMTKEEAMLGIWASKEYSDSEDDDQFSYQKQKKYSKSNIDFISSKKSQGESEKASDNDSDKEDLRDLIQKEELLSESDSENDNMEELKTKNFYQVKQSNITTSTKPVTQKKEPKITK